MLMKQTRPFWRLEGYQIYIKTWLLAVTSLHEKRIQINGSLFANTKLQGNLGQLSDTKAATWENGLFSNLTVALSRNINRLQTSQSLIIPKGSCYSRVWESERFFPQWFSGNLFRHSLVEVQRRPTTAYKSWSALAYCRDKSALLSI